VRKLACISVCLFVVSGPAAAGPRVNLATLTRTAAKVSGLRARSRPRVVVLAKAAMQERAVALLDREYPPDQQAYDETLYRALGLLPADQPLRPFLLGQAQSSLGLYDPVARRIYVRSGSTLQRTLLRQLVTALEDQAFGLRRLSGIRAGRRDTALAGGAAVDAYAAFAAGERAGKTRPVARTTPPLGAFLTVESRFAQTTGLRFFGALRAIGGRRAIFTALRRFPATTEQILHLDAFLGREPAASVSLPTVIGKFGLERQDAFGELDVRALLSAFGVPQIDRAATGWGGGRTGVYRDSSGRQSVVLALDWDESTDAGEWAQAVPAYLAAAFGGAGDVAFAQNGVATALAFGPTAADAATIARATVAG
jgi:hypothetical protein